MLTDFFYFKKIIAIYFVSSHFQVWVKNLIETYKSDKFLKVSKLSSESI